MRRVRVWVAASALVILCYWPVLRELACEWYRDEDMGHAFLAPLAAGWIAWQQRQRLTATRPSAWCVPFMLAGGALQFLGAISLGLFAGALGFLCTVLGIVLAAGGVQWLRVLAFPLCLLLFMLPKPDFLWNQVTLPLQLLATWMATGLAVMAGAPVLREGNVLLVAGHRIAVEEACNGIRYVAALGFVGLLWGHVRGLRGWGRVLLGVCAVPVAILVNALRVAAVAVMCQFNYAEAMGRFHDASGWAAMVLGLVLLAGLERAIRVLPAGGIEREPEPVISQPRQPVWLLCVALILVAQAAPMRLGPSFGSPQRLAPLSRFPQRLGDWRMTRAEMLPAEELAGLNADDWLARFYEDPKDGGNELELRVAFYGSQRMHALSPHSPRLCLPANGWKVMESRSVQVPGGEANLYVASKEGASVTILYWYQTPWQTLANEWHTRGWVVLNGIVHRRTDVALVRLVAPGAWDPGKGVEAVLAFAPLAMSEVKALLR